MYDVCKLSIIHTLFNFHFVDVLCFTFKQDSSVCFRKMIFFVYFLPMYLSLYFLVLQTDGWHNARLKYTGEKTACIVYCLFISCYFPSHFFCVYVCVCQCLCVSVHVCACMCVSFRVRTCHGNPEVMEF